MHKGENREARGGQHATGEGGIGKLPRATSATELVSQAAHEEQQEGDRERQDEREEHVLVVVLSVEVLHLLGGVMVARRRSADRERDHGDYDECDSRKRSEALPSALLL